MQLNQMDNYDKDPNLLDKFGRDIIKDVKDGKIDPVIGRDDEIRQVIKILSRKTKNNPVLIGEPGVGKTAIIEGLAQRIVNKDVPLSLQNKTIFELDMASLVAGAKFRGEFEERLKAVLNRVKDSNGEIIMFIDEIHTIVGAGRTDGALDASNMLKPMLARGEFHCVGATTLNEYKLYIEKDRALERRFQRVQIDEPNVEDTITILRGLKDSFEAHHGVTILDSALISAATLSNRYITDRYLPDKAIDLIDEASASIRMQIDSMPEALDEVLRKIMNIEIEKTALTNEINEQSKIRIKKLNEEITSLKIEENKLKDKWQKEKDHFNLIKTKKESLETLKLQLSNALNENNYELAAKLQYQEIPNLEKEIINLSLENSDDKLLSEIVDDNLISDVISKWTHIPVSKIKSAEKEKLLNLKDDLKLKVLGQDHAIDLISDAIIRQRSGIKSDNKPIGSFLFLGPTGVGKTEVSKVLAENLFDSKDHIVRFDMSEYMENHSVSRLIGAPPGYVGYNEGGQLTESIRRKPYSIVLFDEVEKAHVEVFNLLLQILDDGRLTDNQGRVVDFKNTIIIMTSNLGSHHYHKDNFNEDLVINDVKRHFRPEFINRIDEIIIFNSLNIKVQEKISLKLLNELKNDLLLQDINIDFDKSIVKYVLDNGFNEAYGARPLKRLIDREIKTFIAYKLINNEILAKNKYNLTIKNNKLTLN